MRQSLLELCISVQICKFYLTELLLNEFVLAFDHQREDWAELARAVISINTALPLSPV